jgi:hypothetical protein
MKKIAFLAAFAAIGVLLIAAKCTLKGVTVTEIDGEVWYSAEVEYTDNGPTILKHKFAVGFINDGALATSKTVDGCLRSLTNGRSNFFSANSGLADNKVDTAISRLVGPLTFGDVVNGEITFSLVDVTRDNEQLIVNGRIKNTDNDDLENLRVCVVVRNSDGDITVVKVDNNNYDLNSDETQDFSVEVTVPDDTSDVDKVDLWIDGTNADEGDDVTEPQGDDDHDVSVCGNTATNTPTSTGTPATSTPTKTPVPTQTAGGPTATNTPVNTATATATLADAC